jgi:hypothetical protein
MRGRGRPRTGQIQLRDGFYIEVCNKGMKKGVKIRSDSKKAMEDAAGYYEKYKEVIILGEYNGGVPVAKITVS